MKNNTRLILILFLMLFFSIFFIFKAELGIKDIYENNRFVVITNHYGSDSKSIEKEITIPLEDSISSINGIKNISSSSEYGKSRIDIELHRGFSPENFYLELRDRIDREYSYFQKSIQKPQIIFGNSSNNSIFIVSFYSDFLTNFELSDLVEKKYKPEFSKINDTGEIEIGGISIEELHVKGKNESSYFYKKEALDIASFLQSQMIFSNLGKITNNQIDKGFYVSGIPNTIDDIKNLYVDIDSKIIKLNDIANVSYGLREKDSISRINNEQKIVLYIKAKGDANIIALCKNYRNIINTICNTEIQTEIVFDKGSELENILTSVFYSIFISMFIVIIFVFLWYKNIFDSLLLSLILPLCFIFTIAFLSLLKITIDHYILIGVAIGLGLVIDNGIIMNSFIKTNSDSKRIIPSIVASTLTSVIVLFPLIINKTNEQIKSISISLLILLTFSMFISTFFVPPFTQKVSYHKEQKLLQSFKAFLLKLCNSSLNKPLLCITLLLCSVFTLIISLILIPVNISNQFSENTIFAQLEFDNSYTIEEVDKETKELITKLKKNPYIKQIETISKRGNSEFSITYDSKKINRKKMISIIESESKHLENGFLFINENSKSNSNIFEIKICGSDYFKLKEIAKNTCNIFANNSHVVNTVLYFKEDSFTYIFYVDYSKLTFYYISTEQIANFLKWNLYGPVALKIQKGNSELDLRVMGEDSKNLQIADILKLNIKNSSGRLIQLSKLGTFCKEKELSRIYRTKRQRCASFSIETDISDIDKNLDLIKNTLKQINIPSSYGFFIDQKSFETSSEVNNLLLNILFSVFLVYAVLVIIEENFFYPLLIIISIVFSISLPLLMILLIKESLNTSVITSLIILCGISVNNTILIIEAYRENAENISIHSKIIDSVKSRLDSIILTSSTSILGTIPMIVSGLKSFSFQTTVSFVLFWGIIASVVFAIYILPAILLLTKKAVIIH